jgi:uncharacterized protein YndB with AHSA1/START domain
MKSMKRSYKINASLDDVFAALTDAKVIAKWSGKPAKMDAKKGGAFSLFGGGIHGTNTSVSKSKIAQQWMMGKWKQFSTVEFSMSEAKGVTTIKLAHTGIPDGDLDTIKSGWDSFYMSKLKDHAEANGKVDPAFAPFVGRKGVTIAKMFGWDCLKVNGNVFLTLTPDAVVVKLSSAGIEKALKIKGADYFEPMKGGPKMKEWISIPGGTKVGPLAEAAYDFVSKMPSKLAKKK